MGPHLGNLTATLKGVADRTEKANLRLQYRSCSELQRRFDARTNCLPIAHGQMSDHPQLT